MYRLFGCLAALAVWVIPAAAAAQASPSAYTYATRYDAMHRVVGTIAPDPDGSGPLHYAATRTTYDAAGRVIEVEKGELLGWPGGVAPSGWETATTFTVGSRVDTTYDAMDRKLTEKTSSGGIAYALTQYSYDLEGRLQCTAERMNPAVYASLPASACTLGTAGSQGPDRITENVYDAAGQLIQMRRAVGTPVEQAYATYSYTPDGKQQYVIDANGNRAQLTYDGFDRQAGWYFPSPSMPSAFNGATQATALSTAGAASTTDYEAYGYDANGNRTSLKKRDGRTIAYSYDALDRVTLKDVPGGAALDVYYGYDLQGRQLYARFGSASGTGITNVYDGFGELTSSSSNMGGTARTLAYQYDADGNRMRVTYPDGNYWTYGYDGLDRANAVKENGTTQVAAFAYDAMERRSSDSRGAVTQAYGYDGASRLTSLSHDLAGTADDVSWTLGYNPANQIVSSARSNDLYAYAYTATSKSYTVNGLNQYTTAGGATLAYDANGNITSDGTTTYGYDVENRLITASSGVTLDYDPTGRLWRVTSPTTLTTFLYDGDALVEERNSGGTLLRRYIHGNEEDDPLLWYEGAGLTDRRGMTVDHQGSIAALANASGTLIQIDSYDEYGVPGASNIGRFQYTGQAWIPELGIYYYKARMYSSRLGRFLQTDPVGYKDQVNLYAYVANDPVNHTDPTGLMGGPVEEDSAEEEDNFGRGSTQPGNRPFYQQDFYEAGKQEVLGEIGSALGRAYESARSTVSSTFQEVTARGRAAEQRVLESLGLTKNTRTVQTREGRARPDALTPNVSLEVKDTARVSATRQVRIETGAARASGRQSVLVTGTKTSVSAPAQQLHDQIIRRNDLGPQ